jgi:hypothetical protein
MSLGGKWFKYLEFLQRVKSVPKTSHKPRLLIVYKPCTKPLTERSVSRGAPMERSGVLVVSIEVAVEVRCCFTVFSC